jgi:hypothetical protein
MSSSNHNQGPRWLDAQLHVLDRQVLDVDGITVAVVDDLELSQTPVAQDIPRDTPSPVITALLSGAALATRIFGGRPPESRTARTPWAVVRDVSVVIRLSVGRDATDLSRTERWVREQVIGRIPGGRHVPKGEENERAQSDERAGS